MKHGWEYKKLDNIALIKGRIGYRGYTKNDLVPAGEGAITLSPANIIDYKISYEKCQYISWFKYEESPEIMIYNGDVIYAKTASIGKVALVRDLPEKATINPQFVVLKEIKCYNTYLYYVLRSNYFKQAISLITNGVAIPTVSQSNMGNINIPIPPIEEQKSICSLLDKLSLVIEKKKQQVKELDNLAQAIFYDMFGDVNTNNHSYDIQTLSSVCEILTDGTHQTPEYTQDIVNGVKFLSAKDVVGGVINWNNIKYIPQSLHESLYSRLAPKRNDILLCKNGTTGIAAVVETDEIFDIYVSLALLRLKDGYLPKYILYAINNPTTKQQFDDSLKGVGVPNLHLGEIKKTRIVVPPLPLQQSFAQKVESIERQKELINQSIAEVQTLFDSQMEYFFGE